MDKKANTGPTKKDENMRAFGAKAKLHYSIISVIIFQTLLTNFVRICGSLWPR